MAACDVQRVKVVSLILGLKTTVFEQSVDLCDYTMCPVLPNQPKTITFSGDSEASPPEFGKYLIRVEIVSTNTGAAEELITCVEEVISFDNN